MDSVIIKINVPLQLCKSNNESNGTYHCLKRDTPNFLRVILKQHGLNNLGITDHTSMNLQT